MIEAGARLVNEQRDFSEREVILTSLHVARDWSTDPPATRMCDNSGHSVMKSVPPRGSGWVRKSRTAHRLPTRYRVVVLTSSPRTDSSIKRETGYRLNANRLPTICKPKFQQTPKKRPQAKTKTPVIQGNCNGTQRAPAQVWNLK